MLDDKEEKAAIEDNPLLTDDKTGSSQVMAKPRTGRGKKVGITILVIILIAATAGGVYYWQQQQMKKQKAELESQIESLKKQVSDAEQRVADAAKAKTSNNSESATLQEKEFSIVLPAGWQKTDKPHTPHSANYRYENKSTNDFFDVIMDLQGDAGGDMYWDYTLGSDKKSIVVSKQGFQCTAGVCQKGDGQLVVLISSDPQGLEIAGHNYLFAAGNTKSETADTAIYKKIVESIKIN